jgi:pyruvate formate lyase activating enzyme
MINPEDTDLEQALLWEPAGDKKVRCRLCNHRCLIAEGKLGRCSVRKNIAGMLYSLNYHHLCSANVDPIEKKPLFHFQPGSRSYSIAAPGCNFRCQFCQNWQISQMPFESGQINGQSVRPEQIVTAAKRQDCRSIAYTYTEPTVYMEFCSQCAPLAKDHGLANVFVSNGYMTREAIELAGGWLDGINIDLKAFSDEFYRQICQARLKPVLQTISHIARHTNIWLEITTLVVPGQNDSLEQLKQIAEFIVNSAGPDVPWHVSRFFPNYKYTDSAPTPATSLQQACEIGKKAGLHYVYVGNLPGTHTENTYCYKCGQLLIERTGYTILANRIKKSCCPDCGTKIAGVWL